MKADVKARWVEALRSGKYEQGYRRLRQNSVADGRPTFCCLGVLCDLVDPDGWEQSGPYIYKHADGEWLNLPESVCMKVGVDRGKAGLLAEMNDGGDTFDTIADYIEANL